MTPEAGGGRSWPTPSCWCTRCGAGGGGFWVGGEVDGDGQVGYFQFLPDRFIRPSQPGSPPACDRQMGQTAATEPLTATTEPAVTAATDGTDSRDSYDRACDRQVWQKEDKSSCEWKTSWSP